MAEESNGSISSKRSSLWLKEIAPNGLSGWLSFETTRTALRRRRDVYKRLKKDEFRVLRIEQYGEADAVSKSYSCHLDTHKLSSFPSEEGYAAVSYTWKSHAQRWNYGHDHASVQIQDQPFPEASRVAPMLATLYESGFRNVWIDALCINQLDVAERSNQVALMRQIYANASRVVVFLGSGSTNTDALFDFLQRGVTKGLRMSNVELSGLFEVVSNPYWQRAWIIQEVAVARSIVLICGSKRTSWDVLVHALARWDVSAWALPISSGSNSPGREIRMIDNFRIERHGSLIDVLQKTRSSKASNHLDTVYAKLGLANDASALVSRIDYSMDASTLFKSIVKRHVATKHDLYIMCLVREAQESDMRLPSWAPDWSKSTNRYPLLRFYFSGWMNIIHRAHPKMDVSFSRDLSDMRVRGTQLDSLGQYAGHRRAIDRDAQDVFPSICRTALAAHFVLPGQNDGRAMPTEFIELLARTAVRLDKDDSTQVSDTKCTLHTTLYAMATAGDSETSSARHPWETEKDTESSRSDDFRRWYQANREVMIGGKTVGDWAKVHDTAHEGGREGSTSPYDLSTGGIERSLTAMAWNRKLTGTVSGRPALVPEAARDDDLVCALYGCPVPVVLRRSRRHYIFIGECFVDGFMDEKQHFGTELKPTIDTIFNIR